MALTESQVKVLAALAVLDPTQVLTVRELCDRAGRKEAATRAAVQGLAEAGLAHGSRVTPTGWRITVLGRSLLQAPPYREYLQSAAELNGAGRT